MNSINRVRIIITGNAQRVGFRHKAFQAAIALGITGHAMYVDQSVIIEAEGSVSDLASFISWCHTGPEGCIIDSIDVSETGKLFSKSFEIVPGVVASKPCEVITV